MNLFFATLCSLAATAVLSSDTACTLNCANGSCRKGSADFTNHILNGGAQGFDFHQVQEINGEYCECDAGYTGVLCNHTYTKCNNGDHTCYHGGQCHPVINVHTNQPENVCDCRTAEHPTNGNKYVGKYCEKIATGYCDSTGTNFCVNGGNCVQGSNAETTPCDCPQEFEGRHCEYNKGMASACDMTCHNGGVCTVGLRESTTAEQAFDPSFVANHPTKFQHCACKAGFLGTNCEHTSEICGDRHCFNGATCMSKKDSAGNDHFHCDCSTVNNNTHSFAGRGCESHSTSFCTASPNLNGHTFCTNSGQCQDRGDGVYDCVCPGGFMGPHCEFPTNRPQQENNNCTLQCMNGGKCQHGIKDHGVLNQLVGSIDHLINQTAVGFQHCQCPTGFAGVFCEHEAQVCGTGEHACFHGSKCVKDGEEWQCDCNLLKNNDQNSDNKVQISEAIAGKFCQHKATSLCEDIEAREEIVHRHFCSNDGQCALSEDGKNVFCECTGGFHGRHCQYENEEEPVVLQSSQNSSSETPDQGLIVMLFSSIFALVGVVIVVIVVFVTSRNQTASPKSYPQDGAAPQAMRSTPPIEAFPAPAAATAVSGGDESDTPKGEGSVSALESEII